MNLSRQLLNHSFLKNKSINNYTYKELFEYIKYYKDIFKHLQPQDRVCISGYKSIEYVATLFATWEKNSIIVPIPKQNELIIQKCKPKIIIHNNEIVEYHKKYSSFSNNDLNISTLLFSSGTTNEPKGILLTHEQISKNLELIDSVYKNDITDKDKSFSILPWYHCYGLVCELLYLLKKGGNIIIPTYQENPTEMIKEIKWNHPTLLFTVPKMLERIQKSDIPYIPYSLKKYYLFGTQLRMMSVGGSYCCPNTLDFISKKYGIDVYQGYGMTECGPIISLNHKNANKLGSVGKPLDTVQLYFDSLQEISIQSPSLMLGYFDKIENNTLYYSKCEPIFPTGDTGYLDTDGYLYVNGRIKHQFKLTNGKYINPIYIESLILESKYIDQIILFPSKDHSYIICIVYSQKTNDLQVIQKEIENALTQCQNYEKPKRIELLKYPFTIENKYLSLKYELKRHLIIDNYFTKKMELL
jgi:long-chain acyl-CoA synthetase